MPRHPEYELHRAVSDYLALTLPEDAWFTTFPLGGGGRARGAMLRGLGTQRGTPDIFICHQGRLLCIELKAPGGRLSKAQVEMHRALTRAGAVVTTCYDIGAVCQALNAFGIPTRARVAA